MCHKIITDLVVLGKPQEDQLSDAAPFKEMHANVNVEEVNISNEVTIRMMTARPPARETD
jgi:hypothetical protein